MQALDRAQVDIVALWAEPWGRGAKFAFGWGEKAKYLAIRFPDGAEMTCHWNDEQALAEYGPCELDPPGVYAWKPRCRPGPVDDLEKPHPKPGKPLSPFEE